MSTQIDTRGPLERAYDEAETTHTEAEHRYDEAEAGSEEESHARAAMDTAETALDVARDAYAESDEPRNYDLSDGGGGSETIYCCPSEAKQKWEEWMSGGEWGDGSETSWVHGSATDTLTDTTHSYSYTIEADEPDCIDGEDHDWSSPYSVLGGLKDNPGVWGHGGGVICKYVCAHCGWYRITDSWAQDPETGEQGLESVRYEEADTESESWLWRRLAGRVEEIDIPEGYAIRRDNDARTLRLVRDADDEEVSLTEDEMREVVASESWDAIIEQMPDWE